MKQRCNNPNDDWFSHYGGRGIKVCEEWCNNFDTFYNWAIENGYREELTLDRIDVNGNYEPLNCRWATAKIQQRNRTDRVKYDFFGEKLLLCEISEITNIPLKTLWARVNRGKPIIYPNDKITKEEADKALKELKENEK